MAEIILQNPPALGIMLVAWLLAILLAWPRRFRPADALLFRLFIIFLLGLALAQPAFIPPSSDASAAAPRWVVLVDHSDSLGQAGRTAADRAAARLVGQNPNAVRLYFADRPSTTAEGLNPAATDLAAALRLAGELLAPDGPGRVLLLSDGLPTRGDVQPVLAELARRGIPVDVVPLEAGTGQREVRLVAVSAPETARQGEPVILEVQVHSREAVEATLRLSGSPGGNFPVEDRVLLAPGMNRFRFETRLAEPGVHTFVAQIQAPGDGLTINNAQAAVTRVYPPPRVLVVGQAQRPAAQMAGWLQQAGFETRRIRPDFLPDRLSALAEYEGVVLVDVPAHALTLEQQLALQEFVRSLGRGVVATGGRQSFSLGNYAGTPLEDLLPVTMEPLPREERPPVALLLLMDHSGSMVENEGLEVPTKLAMAKEAAIRATDVLGPEDRLGVLMFDHQFEWVVPFQPVQDGAALLRIQQAIATIPGGGGTRLLQALEAGLAALVAEDVGPTARHAVLLTDGRSFDGPRGVEDYETLVKAAREAGVTLSTIAIGTDADVKLLAQLAEWGQGRYHFAGTPEELPALTISESDILRSNAVQEGDFIVAVAGPHPMGRGFSGAPLPNLSGYIALTPKPRAEVVLQAGPQDPLLTVWGYGLGRAAAWTSDVGQTWAAAWEDWPQAGRFWGQVVGYTLPAPGRAALLQVSVQVEDGGVATLTADAVSETGEPVDAAPPEVTLTTPAGETAVLALRQTSPGRYRQEVRLKAAGAYRVQAVQSRRGGEPVTAETGFVVPYPAEYALPSEEAGIALLRQIAAETGGRVWSVEDEPINGQQPSTENHQSPITNRQPPAGTSSPIELWPWLVQVALILWPVEIAWRRWRRMRI